VHSASGEELPLHKACNNFLKLSVYNARTLVEAPSGIEPPNHSVASSALGHLGTALGA
jgi:hypothetical protein